METISQGQVIQWLISMLGGGLAGASLSIAFGAWNSRRLAREHEAAIIDALIAEVRSTLLLCKHNSKLQHASLAPFITFTTVATVKAVFEERERYPRLAGIQTLLEDYTLALLRVNQLIELYRVISPLAGTAVHQSAIERDNLRNSIAAICSGDGRIEGIGSEGFLIFPSYVEVIQTKIVAIQTQGRRSPPPPHQLLPSV